MDGFDVNESKFYTGLNKYFEVDDSPDGSGIIVGGLKEGYREACNDYLIHSYETWLSQSLERYINEGYWLKDDPEKCYVLGVMMMDDIAEVMECGKDIGSFEKDVFESNYVAFAAGLDEFFDWYYETDGSGIMITGLTASCEDKFTEKQSLKYKKMIPEIEKYINKNLSMQDGFRWGAYVMSSIRELEKSYENPKTGN